MLTYKEQEITTNTSKLTFREADISMESTFMASVILCLSLIHIFLLYYFVYSLCFFNRERKNKWSCKIYRRCFLILRKFRIHLRCRCTKVDCDFFLSWTWINHCIVSRTGDSSIELHTKWDQNFMFSNNKHP